MNIRETLDAGKLPRDLLPWRSPSGHLNAKLHQGDAFLFDTRSLSTIHLVDSDGFGGYTVMDDSDRELCRHLQAVMLARGRVLKTGLGFGCFVRMALLNPEVTHVDVVEKDPDIAEHFGRQFAGNPRVTIHVGDAFEFPLVGQFWDLIWHDIYCDGNDGLARLHCRLMIRYRKVCGRQGAWAINRWFRRIAAERLRVF